MLIIIGVYKAICKQCLQYNRFEFYVGNSYGDKFSLTLSRR